jgi:hypothetical protein
MVKRSIGAIGLRQAAGKFISQKLFHLYSSAKLSKQKDR